MMQLCSHHAGTGASFWCHQCQWEVFIRQRSAVDVVYIPQKWHHRPVRVKSSLVRVKSSLVRVNKVTMDSKTLTTSTLVRVVRVVIVKIFATDFVSF